MSCCGKKSCQKAHDTEPTTTDAAAFSVFGAGSAIVSKLLEVTKTGVGTLFDDPRLTELAMTISTLVTENQYLKKLARLLPGAPEVHATPESISFVFGPDAEYKLTVPVTPLNRQKLADQLFRAAMTLKANELRVPTAPTAQLLLFSQDAADK